MKEKCDPETIINALKEKGYDDHFSVEVFHLGKLEDSLKNFFKDCHSDEGILNGFMQLSCYLQTKRPDQSRIRCEMYCDYKMGQFSISRMVITHEDRFRREQDHCVLDVTLQSIPTANEAIKMMTDKMMTDKLNKRMPTNMEKSYTAEEVIMILTNKGYDGYFTTQACYPNKLCDSLRAFLRDLNPEHRDMNILLETYLLWNRADKPTVRCLISLENYNGKYALDVMDIIHRDGSGKLINKKIISDISIDALPTKDQAIKMVCGEVKEISSTIKKGRRL